MIKNAKWRQQGVTIFELLLVVSVVAAILLMAGRQYFAYTTDSPGSYAWTRQFTQLQSNVAALFQASSAYYYANCPDRLDVMISLSCEKLVAAGGFKSLEECNRAMEIPHSWAWGKLYLYLYKRDPSSTDQPGYYMHIEGLLYYPQGDPNKLAELLGGRAMNYDPWGSVLIGWERLPAMRIVNQGGWYKVPGNLQMVNSANALGGSPLSSGLWIASAGLAQWTKEQQQYLPPDQAKKMCEQ